MLTLAKPGQVRSSQAWRGVSFAKTKAKTNAGTGTQTGTGKTSRFIPERIHP
jgi:hypothetical protein